MLAAIGFAAPAQARLVPSSTTTLTPSANPAPVGTSVTLTAMVTSGGSVPTGTVQFLDGSTPIGSVSLDVNGNAAITTSALALGSHTIVAEYSGDSGTLASASSALTLTIALGTSATTIVAGTNPLTAGASETLTANVTSNGLAPTGSVAFVDGATTLATVNVDANGNAALTTSSLALGQHSIVAQYAGDINTQPSNSTALAVTVQPPPKADFLPSASGSTMTLRAGESGTAAITFVGTFGYASKVTLGCSGLPANSTCSFTPSTLTPNAGGVQSVVTISTAGPNIGFVGAQSMRRAIVPSVLLLVIAPFLRRRRAASAALAAAMLLAGCSHGATTATVLPVATPTPAPVTPSGTSTVTVTANGADGTTHTLALTVVVTP